MAACQVGNALIALGEMGENTPTGGIREGGKGAIQAGRIFNHLVKY